MNSTPAPAASPKIDCHVHVFDPERFPYASDVAYRPAGHEIATAQQLGFLLDAHDVRHALLVGPNSGYNLDNRCLLDALARRPGRYRGIAVVARDASVDELAALKAQGVVGVSLQAVALGVEYVLGTGPLLQRLRELDLWADVQVEHDQLLALAPMLVDSGTKLVFDHCGRPHPERGVGQPGFQALLALASTGRVAVKLSSFSKASVQPFPHEDAWPTIRALIDAYGPASLVWASDWPFLRAAARTDYGPLLALFEALVPDEAARRAICWDTPRRLFGFGD